jgi:HK97 family phage major capsid protein
MAQLPLYADRNAKWYCSKQCKVGVFDRLILSAGGITAREMMEGTVPRFAGYPIVQMAAMPAQDQPAATLNGVIMLFFGDLSLAATLGTRRGITVKRLEERYAEYDQIGIQATERMCINVHDIGGAAGVYGPVVGLQGTT